MISLERGGQVKRNRLSVQHWGPYPSLLCSICLTTQLTAITKYSLFMSLQEPLVFALLSGLFLPQRSDRGSTHRKSPKGEGPGAPGIDLHLHHFDKFPNLGEFIPVRS